MYIHLYDFNLLLYIFNIFIIIQFWNKKEATYILLLCILHGISEISGDTYFCVFLLEY